MLTERAEYCGKDVQVTAMLHEILSRELGINKWLYEFLMRLQLALLTPQERGIRVDLWERDRLLEEGEQALKREAEALTEEAWGAWGSPDTFLQWVSGGKGLLTVRGQPTAKSKRLRETYSSTPLGGATGEGAISRETLRRLFWGHLNIKKIRGLDASRKITHVRRTARTKWSDLSIEDRCKLLKGKKFSCDGDTLRNIDHPLAQRIADYFDLEKSLQFYRSKLGDDDRFRCTFSVGSTKTFRLSSTKNCFGEGGNSQQIPQKARGQFIADEGKILLARDYQTAESHLLAAFVGGAYLRAHESEVDTHAMVGNLMYPELDWPQSPEEWGDWAKAQPSEMGKGNWRNDLKLVQHATNYMQTPRGLAMHLGITVAMAKELQERYFSAFPEIPGIYHEWVKRCARDGEIVVPVEGSGLAPYRRRLYNTQDLNDVAAHMPQSLLALISHTSAIRLIDDEAFLDGFEYLLHVHDEHLCQTPIESAERDMKTMRLHMRVPIILNENEVCLRTSGAMGKRWSDCK